MVIFHAIMVIRHHQVVYRLVLVKASALAVEAVQAGRQAALTIQAVPAVQPAYRRMVMFSFIRFLLRNHEHGPIDLSNRNKRRAIPQ